MSSTLTPSSILDEFEECLSLLEREELSTPLLTEDMVQSTIDSLEEELEDLKKEEAALTNDLRLGIDVPRLQVLTERVEEKAKGVHERSLAEVVEFIAGLQAVLDGLQRHS
uniref:Uncharacterized protein n=1 Tax=Palpitomonas bilix TaxID=652834 RepID=A0A7S3DDA2_9EUKA|mmetsp:Transcript_32783/g.84666  ORF Transcript_32783/g.84666 Transcript_32783/m.84666 type:complete len:111 (+) Transcript_32783:136-468(+)